ncbi:MAG TPA: CPBP family glutamic-type intramembrane protease [Polyangia bacterium]|nr:CPBP family glutamic-type intramembrane protease [Polyangia bacterium]
MRAFSHRRRWVELIALYGIGPALLALGPRWMVTVGILGIGLVAAGALLFDPSFARGDLVGLAGARRGARTVVLRTVLLGTILVVGAAVFSPRPLMPQARPVVWAIVMVLYPISAYAQEIVCRTLFFHRYAQLFPRPAARVVASGVVFGWAHVAVNNLAALGLATAAGIIFAATYERWRSTLLVSLEHALYGDFAFTAGLGALFYSHVRWVTWGGR